MQEGALADPDSGAETRTPASLRGPQQVASRREEVATMGRQDERIDAFPPSAKRDDVEWITEAKREATREKRLATTIAWLREGKRRNWKYEQA